MPARTWFVQLAMLSLFVLSGCGTLSAHLLPVGQAGERVTFNTRLYEGVQRDLEGGAIAIERGLTGVGGGAIGPVAVTLLGTVVLMDVPFSAVADTLVLPCILFERWDDEPSNDPRGIETQRHGEGPLEGVAQRPPAGQPGGPKQGPKGRRSQTDASEQ
jgi:uncharacterized protein YceK